MYSQVDSIKDLLNFYPLQNGNYWEYKIINYQMPYPPDSIAYSIEIKGDTTLDNNFSYKILAYHDIYPNHYTYYDYVRIDSLTGCVFRYYKDSTLANDEYKIDSLFAQPGDTIHCSGSFQSSGNYLTICLSAQTDTVLEITTQVKTFDDISMIPATEYGIAKGFGHYFAYGCEVGCSYGSLVYAKIDGIEYGNKITVVNNKDNFLPTELKLYQNYPNPFNPITNIAFEIPGGGYVIIKIYDVLGKEIDLHKLYYSSSGKHAIVFNGSNYSSGVYFYQIQYKRMIETKKMLLIK